MHSSRDLANRLELVAKRCLVAALAIFTSCSPLPPVGQSAPASAPTECSVAGGGLSPQDADALATLRRTVEKGPLYDLSASKPGVATCVAKSESGEHTLEYTFRDGGSMQVTYQPRIEYNDQEVRFASPLRVDPLPVLMRAEHAAFGADGCGIDWRQPEKRPPDAERVTETIYRGDVCNCQARVRSDTAGRVVGLIVRSAC